MVLEVVAALKQDVNSALSCLCVTVLWLFTGPAKKCVQMCSLFSPTSHEMSNTVLRVVLWGLVLLNPLIKGRELFWLLQVHHVPLLGMGVQESGVFWHRHWELGLAFGNCTEMIPVVCCPESAIHEIPGVKKLL